MRCNLHEGAKIKIKEILFFFLSSSSSPVQLCSLNVAQAVRLGSREQQEIRRDKVVVRQPDDVADLHSTPALFRQLPSPQQVRLAVVDSRVASVPLLQHETIFFFGLSQTRPTIVEH